MSKFKVCTKCEIEKELSEFSKDKQKKDGFCSTCKVCTNKRVKKYNQTHSDEKKIYDKNRRFILKNELLHQKAVYYYENMDKILAQRAKIHKKEPYHRIYAGIKQRCNNPNAPAYKRYGGRGIKCLITKEEIKFLMERDGYWNLKKPTLDRINNNGNYCLENCRFIEHFENTGKDQRRPILQYDLQGNLVKEYISGRDAAKNTGLNYHQISNSARGIEGTGFIWRYKQ
jgi:hypothetical protein